MTAAPDKLVRGPIPALLWACYLGSSWTWIIGMILPALLVRDFGLWGWVVFAVPNVFGAAAMGFVLSTPARSRSVVKNHREAALRFSEITIAYHVFVVGAIYQHMFGNWGILATAAIVIVLFMVVANRRRALSAAVIVTCISLIVLAIFLGNHSFGDYRILPVGSPWMTTTDLLLFAPASLVGFALCPYLDLTFHRARQYTERVTGYAAFTIGFCVVFLLMIVLSLLYSNGFNVWTPTSGAYVIPLLLLGAHMTVQAGFTIAIHLREITEQRGHAGLHRVFMLAIAAGALAWWVVSDPFHREHGRYIGEVIYRTFLLFYGLAFPGYVFLCMIPTRRRVTRHAKLAVFLGALLAAAPMGYAGFVMGQSWWILGALGALALGRGIIELLPATSEHTAP